jgi:two-component system, OmpR family, sensor histidine kinase CpxA
VGGIGLKIFLSFWLIFAMLIALFAILPSRFPGVRFSDHVRQHGLVAAAALEDSGPSACAQIAAAIERGTGIQLLLLDDEAVPLCSTSGAELEIFEAVLSARGDLAQSSGDTTVAIVQIVTPRGRSLRAAGRAPPGFSAVPVRPPVPWGSLGLTILVSGLVCFLVARYLAKPLQLVRDASNRLALGQLQARAGPTGEKRHDEIGDLVRAFDSMAARLEALVHAQGQILSDISHELRSPLARLSVALELARRKSGQTAAAELDRIQVESDRMNELIGRVLALARAEQDPNARTSSINLRYLVGDVVADASYEAQQDHKSVSFQPRADPEIVGDPELVASAIDNVIRNAVRYTPAQGTVEVTLSGDAHAAVIVVRDHGPGVPAAELERIFSPFHRVDASRTRAENDAGVGLGLAIARRSIDVHGGSITAENAPDGGLRVTIRLPIAGPATEPGAADTSLRTRNDS